MSDSRKNSKKFCKFFSIFLILVLAAAGTLAILHFTKVINIPFLSSQNNTPPEDKPVITTVIDPKTGNEIPGDKLTGPRLISFLNKKVLPPKDGIIFGSWLYGDNYVWVPTADQWASRVGYNAGIIGVFVKDTSTSDLQNLQDASVAAKRTGAALLVTWEPFQGLNTVTDEYLTKMVSNLKPINDAGVSIVLRWAHEMNGGWYEWGQRPSLYRNTWIRMAKAVRDGCSLCTLMWAPNSSNGFPFKGPTTPNQGTKYWTEMDTNGDGLWNAKDDPYSPYWPGDEYVDWVGLSLFWYGVNYPYKENLRPPNGWATSVITGNFSNSPPYDFYQTYCVIKSKPLAIAETSAPFYKGTGITSELSSSLEAKQLWWRQLMSNETRSSFPNLKMVSWFEFIKAEEETIRDFSITNSTESVNILKNDISTWPIVFANPPSN